jgi:hypothetical protein
LATIVAMACALLVTTLVSGNGGRRAFARNY